MEPLYKDGRTVHRELPEIVKADPWLEPYAGEIMKRMDRLESAQKRLAGNDGISSFAAAHLFYGLHRDGDGFVFREWAPGADGVFILCGRNSWKPNIDWSLDRINEKGDWEIRLEPGMLKHGDLYRLRINWPGGGGNRIPAYTRRVIQDSESYIFNAQVWDPPEPYEWKHSIPEDPDYRPVIYEAHIGMAQEKPGIGSYSEFEKNIIPRICAGGFNTVQLMAVMEHPYYASFGYQVSSFFAPSSRYGTPEEFKSLVDSCHASGLRVIMDIIHSHSVRNEVEGLSRFDGTTYQYFHEGPRGYHPAWDSRCFDYSRDEVLHFLLSNCAYWLNEFRLDGFRFDGVTSMLYHDHGLGVSFDNYSRYFSDNVDEDALLYLGLANRLIHEINPEAVTIAEDMSGLPGIARPAKDGGCGFNYRLAMGLPDYWIKIIKHRKDQEWDVGEIWGVLNNRRFNEGHIAYAESHDQALVGDKTLIFRLADAAMYSDMSVFTDSLVISRAVSLIKLIYLLTFTAGGNGYMNFMGNEFGHPEWIDFPRDGNGWSFFYARRQWSLADDTSLRYSRIAAFNRDMILRCREALSDDGTRLYESDVKKQVLVYGRGEMVIFLNLNPDVSWPEYPVDAGKGNFRLVLNTDSPEYDGFGRVPDSLMLYSDSAEDGKIRPYLPSRTALVFKREKES